MKVQLLVGGHNGKQFVALNTKYWGMRGGVPYYQVKVIWNGGEEDSLCLPVEKVFEFQEQEFSNE